MRNLVVICLDSVRKDFFDGHTPRIQALADVSCEGCRAASSWSVPSHASMFTGALPHRHGVHAHNLDFSTIPEEDLLTNELAHTTLAVSANKFLTEEFGFDSWFDGCINIRPDRVFPGGLDARDSTGILNHLERSIAHDHPLRSIANGVFIQGLKTTNRLPVPTLTDDGAAAIVARSLDRIETIDEPYFLFTNFMEAHVPHRDSIRYDRSELNVPTGWQTAGFNYWSILEHGRMAVEAHENEVEWFRSLYAAAISYLDRVVASFVKELQARSDREVTVVITADHGENLGYESDGYQFEHTASLSEGVLHVPLVIINPPSKPSIDESPEMWSHLDLPLLLRYLATEADESPFRKRDHVLAEVLGSHFGVNGPEGEHWKRAIRCLYDISGEEKYVWDSLGDTNTYRIDEDQPSWQQLAEMNIDWKKVENYASEMFGEELSTCKNRIAETADAGPEDVSKSTQRRLKELGYI